MIAVFDTSVIASAIFWHTSTARRCLTGLARRKFTLVVTDGTQAGAVLGCDWAQESAVWETGRSGSVRERGGATSAVALGAMAGQARENAAVKTQTFWDYD